MAGISQAECTHSTFTGYSDYCVCIVCGWVIEYENIRLEKNDSSLRNYIKTVLKQSKAERIEFDIGVTPQGLVNDKSLNRIKFILIRQ